MPELRHPLTFQRLLQFWEQPKVRRCQIWAVRKLCNHCEFQFSHDVLCLGDGMWYCIVVMQRKTFLSCQILRMRSFRDRNVAQYLSEFTVNP
ncbi:hypothetical protein TNCV_3204281 [Trichonephila clavipes]|nr:hypothetical protein TNCV_3204281 [Trichonephila clavipes]